MSEEKSFIEILPVMRKGGCVSDLDTELQKVVAAVKETGKVGTLTLKIKIQLAGNGTVAVRDEIKATLPVLPLPETIFFTTEQDGLSREMPKQMKMFDAPDNTIPFRAANGSDKGE